MQGSLWKRLIEAIKDLVTEANFDCSPGGISIQAMDASHVALVHLLLLADGFHKYQCARNTLVGVNLASLSKVLRACENNHRMIFRHEDDADVMVVASESPQATKLSEYHLKLMEIEADSIGIPELDYRTRVSLPAAEFAKIVRDMSVFGDTVTVRVDRKGVKFTAVGDIGEGYAFLRVGSAADLVSDVKGERSDVKQESDDAPLSRRVKREGSGGGDSAVMDVEVTVDEPVALSFALRFLNTFAKGATLSERVTLFFARDSPCMVEFRLEGVGFLRYYLAPKVDDTEP